MSLFKSNNGKNSLFLYVSYIALKPTDFTGRFYNNNITENDKNISFDNEKRIMTYVVPEFEIDNGKIIKNVPVKIYFSDNGWNKIVNFFQ